MFDGEQSDKSRDEEVKIQDLTLLILEGPEAPCRIFCQLWATAYQNINYLAIYGRTDQGQTTG
jgi:hypothetical protein